VLDVEQLLDIDHMIYIKARIASDRQITCSQTKDLGEFLALTPLLKAQIAIAYEEARPLGRFPLVSSPLSSLRQSSLFSFVPHPRAVHGPPLLLPPLW
jgi:hypothetical protein